MPLHPSQTCSVVLDAFTSQPSNDAFLGLMPAFRCAGLMSYSLQCSHHCRCHSCSWSLPSAWQLFVMHQLTADSAPATCSLTQAECLPSLCSGDACAQVLGFHFYRCREDSTVQPPRHTKPAPAGLYTAAAKLVQVRGATCYRAWHAQWRSSGPYAAAAVRLPLL